MVELNLPLRSLRRGGDHTAFNNEGFAGVRITRRTRNFANQHSPTDTFANTSPAYAAKVTRINAADRGFDGALRRDPRSRGEYPRRERPRLRLTRQTPEAVPTPRAASNWSGTHKGRWL